LVSEDQSAQHNLNILKTNGVATLIEGSETRLIHALSIFVAAFVVHSEPHTGARASVLLCGGGDLFCLVHTRRTTQQERQNGQSIKLLRHDTPFPIWPRPVGFALGAEPVRRPVRGCHRRTGGCMRGVICEIGALI